MIKCINRFYLTNNIIINGINIIKKKMRINALAITFIDGLYR